MNATGRWIAVAVVAVCAGWLPAHFALAEGTISRPRTHTNERGRILLSMPLPKMDGGHLKAVLMEVRYGPGEASPPHSHPCPVIGYVVEGALQTKVKGQPEMVERAGHSFYETPNGVHLISRNASSKKPAKFIALFICDHDAPLSINVDHNAPPKGHSR